MMIVPERYRKENESKPIDELVLERTKLYNKVSVW